MASEKRLTTFPGRQTSAGPGSAGLSKPTKSSQNRQIPPRLPLGISQGSKIHKVIGGASAATVYSKSPWTKYRGFLEIDQAGRGTVAHQQGQAFLPSVIIKKIKKEDIKVPERIKIIPHTNVVHLQEVFSDGPCLYMIYELMFASLADIQLNPYGDLGELEIATICKEILRGIKYIHKELDMVHGKIDSDHILLSLEGAIKIAGIGERMICLPSSSNKEQDIQALGLIMLELMEPGTGLMQPRSITLTDPQKWSDEARSFLDKAFESAAADDLLKVFSN
ncbi:MAG: hypothetical protein M1840_007613 [Geoglossum simile]|nr:MAG: hypothetical protein M1840_007613 [Geoglossum simile]